MGEEILSIKPGILRVVRGQRLSWKEALKELIDNALDANANNTEIVMSGESFSIKDDGEGCDDLYAMESLASSIKSKHTKAGMYGWGGVMAQIRATNGGNVIVHSVTRDWDSTIVIDFVECIENDRFETKEYGKSPALPRSKTGTKITIERAKRRSLNKPKEVMEELSYSYSDILKLGKKIVFEIDGEKTAIKPFKAPPFEGEQVSTTFDFRGHAISLLCGVVKEGVTNRYSGWSVHWGHRIVKVTGDPANGRVCRRIYGEVHLPETWRNINPTKDDFTEDVEELWEKIGELCSDIIARADQQTTDLEFKDASDMVGDILTRAIGIKGRRPNRNGDAGTRTPTGEGSSHQNFTTSQPGDKAPGVGNANFAKVPSRIRVAFDESLEYAYQIETGGTKNRTMTITLNKSMPQVFHFKNDPIGLAALCCAYIAHEFVDNKKFDGVFPEFKDKEYHEIHNDLLTRVTANCPTVVA
jgi:hypothetical protein